MFAAASLGLAACKMLLVTRININWDEFLYLNAVYTHARDAMTQLFQGAHAHLFLWLTGLPGDEIDQIRTARLVMVASLALTAYLVWLLGRRWLSGFASCVPPFVYLSALPVMQHGGSFRVDSLLAPLLVAALLCCTSSGPLRGRDWYGGALLGVALALTVKTLLFLPMVVVVLLLTERDEVLRPASNLSAALITVGRLLLAAFTCAALLLLLHGVAIAALPADTVAGYAARVAGKTLLDVPLFSQADKLVGYFKWQPLLWLLVALGAATALLERRWLLATLALSLLPIVFYRNAFPYFYVVMLAPTSILAGFAVRQLRTWLRSKTAAALPFALIALIAAGLLYQAMAPIRVLWDPQQGSQRTLLAAVHQIFPEPVAYIDCCGMVSSFRKTNFFMSTWGLEDYRARNVPFMLQSMEKARPDFVLVNTLSLDPGRKLPKGLLAEDLEQIRKFYPVYWGPIRVAGAEGRIQPGQLLELTVPFEGRYRLSTEAPVRVDGRLYQNDDVIPVAAGSLVLRIEAAHVSASDNRVALFIASAQAPPASPPPGDPVFSPL